MPQPTCEACGHKTFVLDMGTGKYANMKVCKKCESENYSEQLQRSGIMKQKIEFTDDILIIDELDDGETYHVTMPALGIDELTTEPEMAVSQIQIPNAMDIEKLDNEITALMAKKNKIQAVFDQHGELLPLKPKITAAIRLITADASVYHRFWGEVRTISIDKDGNVFFGPRAMVRERPNES